MTERFRLAKPGRSGAAQHVEDQTGKRVYAWVMNSKGTWDRARTAHFGTVYAWDAAKRKWVECRLVPVGEVGPRSVLE